MKKILLVLSLFFLWENNAMAAKFCKTQSDCGNGYACTFPKPCPRRHCAKFCAKQCAQDSDCASDSTSCTEHWKCNVGYCHCPGSLIISM